MARTYALRNQVDDNGLALVNVWCRAFNATSGTLIETQYTDSNGSCTFTTLPDDDNVNVCVVWGTKVKWLYNVFSAGQDILYNSLTVNHIDATSITLSALTGDLDDIDNGSTYGRLLLTDISSGHIKLTTNTAADGKWYNSSGVSIDSTAGINIWGTANALTTRATETGTIQCYVGADGKIYAGAGKVYLDVDGVHINFSGSAKLHLYYGAYNNYISTSVNGKLYLDSQGYGILLSGNTEISGTLSPFGTQNIGASGDYWANAYITTGYIPYIPSTTISTCIISGTLRPYYVSTVSCGNSSYPWWEVVSKNFTDPGCPIPSIKNYIDTIMNIRTVKRKLTPSDVEREGMGERALQRVLASPDGVVDDLDIDSFDDELLFRPTKEEYDEAEELYQEQLMEAKAKGEDTALIIKREPKVRWSINDTVLALIFGMQELVKRIENLEENLK